MRHQKLRLSVLLISLISSLCVMWWTVSGPAAAQAVTCESAPDIYHSGCMSVTVTPAIQRGSDGKIIGGTITVTTSPQCTSSFLDVGASLTTTDVIVDGAQRKTNSTVNRAYFFGSPQPVPLGGAGVSGLDAKISHTLVFNVDATAANAAACMHRNTQGDWVGPWAIANGVSSNTYTTAVPFGVAVVPTPTPTPTPTPSFVVNSTGDDSDSDLSDGTCKTGKKLANGQDECTLRAAIEQINQSGTQTITFAGVNKTEPKKAFPDIKVPVTIDGTTAPGGKFEISGPISLAQGQLSNLEGSDFFDGLTITAGNSTLKGLVVNQFGGFGIVLRSGGNNTVQGCYLGTEATGKFARGNGFAFIDEHLHTSLVGGGLAIDNSANNQVGGNVPLSPTDGTPFAGEAPGNVISGNESSIERNSDFVHVAGCTFGTNGLAIVGSASTGNVVQGNAIGASPGLAGDPLPNGVGVSIDDSPGNTIGGSYPSGANAGPGNVIANSDIFILGSRTRTADICETGGPGQGIVISGTAIGNVVQGNVIDHNGGGVEILADKNTIGGISASEGNRITNSGRGIEIYGNSNVVQKNIVDHSLNTGVFIQGTKNLVGGTEAGAGNQISNNGGGIAEPAFGGSGNSFLANSIYNSVTPNPPQLGFSSGLGIDLGLDSVTLNDSSGHDGPNHFQNFPLFFINNTIFPAVTDSSGTHFQGSLTSNANTQFRIEFFSNPYCNPSGYGEGKTFIASTQVTTGIDGRTPIDYVSSTTIPPGQFFTATATNLATGDTSEFSKCTLVHGPTDTDKDRVSDTVENGVPSRSAPIAPGFRFLASSIVAPSVATGDGNGDGIQDSQQANVTSLPDNAGHYVTFAAPNGRVLTNVQPTGIPIPGDTSLSGSSAGDSSSTAQRYAFDPNSTDPSSPNGVGFPEGFLSYGVTGLANGGATTVTFYLPTGFSPNTFWNYGPTSDNTSAHWYEFKFDGTTGAEVQADRVILHFVDGQRGDNDLTKNGQITTLGAPGTAAYVALSAPTFTVNEGDGSAAITFTRTGDTSNPITVDYATSDTAGAQPCGAPNGIASSRCNYLTTIGTLTFAAGATSKTISIPIIDDSYAEGNKAFTVTLSNSAGAMLISPAAATITIIDNDSTNGVNPLGTSGFFVRQHYLDFLNRQPDTSGLNFWVNNIESCGADANCRAGKTVDTSAAFFLSIEFQQTGYLVERIYKASYGDATGNSTFPSAHTLPVPVVRLNEFLPDTQQIGQGVVVGQTGWETVLENNKQAFTLAFVQRSRFTSALPTTMTPDQFVDKLFLSAGVTPSATDRTIAINEFGGAATTSDVAARARALRDVAENAALNQQEFNRAFVLMQFFGYLRRNPNDAPDADYTGFDFWLAKLNNFTQTGDDVLVRVQKAEMVKSFIVSIEYRKRFGTS